MVAQLDTKTVYTFMDSLISIKKYVKTAKALGYQTLGMMDIDNLYGAYHLMEIATAQKIQPILGIEMTLDYAGVPLNLRFLALDSQGYRNLMKLSTLKMIGKSKWEELQHLLEGIAIIVPVFDGIRDLDLGKDFYIGVFPDTPQQDFMHKTVPLHTVRYFDTGDLETLQMLRAIRENSSLREVGHLPSNEYLLSSKQFTQAFQKNFPESLDNLERLVAGVAIIHQMGFDDYFLIVWDLLRFGRSQGYYMGMGRGSAVGSLVAYALEITGIDPVEKNLIFERFLNLERYTMPDIDIDIPDVYRPEFIRYVRDRYGTMHTAQIVTYSTFGAKQAIRDVFKRYGVPEYELTNITRKISFRDTLTSAYEKNMSFRQIINNKLEYQKAFEIAKKIEGNPRQTSIHAAGVVMSDNDLTDHIPLKYGEDMYITQYDAHGVESNGLLKMDFLGLRNLTFVQRMKEAVLEKYGVAINIAKIDLEDTITLQLFAAGRTKGIFQFEQAGAINLLKRVQPVQFEEIVATTSLNRPGASDYIDNFVKRKHGQEKVEMLDSSLETILAPTYGIMLYQEQVMQVAQRFAGFSLGKADILRRAMGKKDATEMHRMEAEFVTGALDLGHSEIKAKEVFAVMEKFAGYGFNRSHAYAYSALAFQLAYFKAHYPDIFFDIMLNYSSSDYITDALEFDFQVASLNINNIPYRDRFQDKQIYLGLKNIKGLPRDVAYWIIENRPFSNVEDFVLKLPTQYHKVQLLTPLVQIGLFDVFEKNRQKILQNLPNLFVFADELGSLFADTNYSWTEAENYTEAEKFELEKEIIGVGLSEHPLVKLAKAATQSFTPIQELVGNTHATILVEILSIRVIRTKTGENMAFLQASDTKRKMEVTVFPDAFKQFGKGLHEKGFYYLTGRIQKRENRLQMILNHLQEANTERFWIQVENHESDAEISAILQQFRGDIPVVIRYENERKTVAIPQYCVQKSEKLQEELKKITMKTIYQ